MKKLLSIFVMTLVVVQYAVAGDVITQDPNQLPPAARSFLAKYFNQVEISHIKIESDLLRGKTYDVLLIDRTELEFDSKGNWTEIDCQRKAVPEDLIPVRVKQYVQVNFPRETITKIERKAGIEVELTSDFSLKFNKRGKFISADD